MKYKLSVVIPTLNAASVIVPCLESIKTQSFDMSKVEIIIGDGGSTDDTVELVKRYGAKVVHNPLKTAESGKAVAVKSCKGEYIALIDSDNVLPNNNWIKEMIEPLEKHPGAVGSEPYKYTWRKEDSYITRYSALTGVNDPLVIFLGNYDRWNLLTNKWTEVPRKEEEHKNYYLVRFDKRGLPTIGANGPVFRASFLKNNLEDDYLFDIDILAKYIQDNGHVEFIKVKNGIVHTYCEGDILKFARKQKRRIKDYLFHQSQKNRFYNWDFSGSNLFGITKFIIYCLTFIPLLVQSIVGYVRKPDVAWFFHPIACYVTLWVYGWERIMGLFSKGEVSRDSWKQ
ncbi:glycosyltransferase [Patescibacteria group bacterium]